MLRDALRCQRRRRTATSNQLRCRTALVAPKPLSLRIDGANRRRLLRPVQTDIIDHDSLRWSNHRDTISDSDHAPRLPHVHKRSYILGRHQFECKHRSQSQPSASSSLIDGQSQELDVKANFTERFDVVKDCRLYNAGREFWSQNAGRWCPAQVGHDLADLPDSHEEALGTAVRVGNGMQFRVHANFGAADQARNPLFYPHA